ncbi:unnamed protein product [Ixodes hexagonus]
MKSALVCLVLAAAVLVATSHHVELCKKNDSELREALDCITSRLPAAFNRKFDRVEKQLGCSNKSCVLRKLCKEGDLDEALKKHFTPAEIQTLHTTATDCDHSHGHGHDHQ